MEFVAEHAHHLLGLAFAEKAVVDVDGDQLLAYGLDEQGRDDRGIDAAGQGEQHFLVADLRTQFLNLFFNEFLGQGGRRDSLHCRRADVTGTHSV